MGTIGCVQHDCEKCKTSEVLSITPYAWVWEVLPNSPLQKRKGGKSGVYLQDPLIYGIDIAGKESIENYKWTLVFDRPVPSPSARTDELALAAATEIMCVCSESGLNLYDAVLSRLKARAQCIVQRAIEAGQRKSKSIPVCYRVRWPVPSGGYRWVMTDAPLLEQHGLVNEALYREPQPLPKRQPLGTEPTVARIMDLAEVMSKADLACSHAEEEGSDSEYEAANIAAGDATRALRKAIEAAITLSS